MKPPLDAPDYLNPELKGKIVSTYPNDDDAVLFWYKQAIDRHGWAWMENFMKQEPHFVRGTQAPSDEVTAGKYAVTFSSDGGLKPDASSPVRFTLPSNDGFVAWAQRAAILKGARHPESARLYLSWLLDKDTQQNVWYMWSVRTDVPAPAGYQPIWKYRNANLAGFERFMADRDAVERFRSRIRLYVGDVKGPSSAGELGLTPPDQGHRSGFCEQELNFSHNCWHRLPRCTAQPACHNAWPLERVANSFGASAGTNESLTRPNGLVIPHIFDHMDIPRTMSSSRRIPFQITSFPGGLSFFLAR